MHGPHPLNRVRLLLVGQVWGGHPVENLYANMIYEGLAEDKQTSGARGPRPSFLRSFPPLASPILHGLGRKYDFRIVYTTAHDPHRLESILRYTR